MDDMDAECGVVPACCATSGRAWQRAGSSMPRHG
jgi:hypothetical protein